MSSITGNAYGAAAYQQTKTWWNNGGKRGDSVKTAEERRAAREGKTVGAGNTKDTEKTGDVSEASKAQGAGQTESMTSGSNVKTSIWSNKGAAQAPIPTYNKDYGTVIGDVSLSKEASDYYNQLKAKFGGMDFVLVSKDQKASVQSNVSKYGNANKPVVLIDDEKLERMATDKDFREKYEGIISMAQNQLSSMKNELSSSGAAIRNFGMSVKEDGSTDYFAVMEKSNKEQAERIEKKRAEKAEARKEAKKTEQKKLAEKRADKKAEAKKAEEKKAAKRADDKKLSKEESNEHIEDKGEERNRPLHSDARMTEYSSSSLEDLVSAVRNAAYSRSLGSVQTAAEKIVGQSIDFSG